MELYTERGPGCWLWQGNIGSGGYGRVWYGRGRQFRAHRVAYELAYGPVPEGLVLDHLCRTRRCVRPDHLEAVSQRINNLRGVGLAAERARVTECVAGHALVGDNVYRPGRGTRDCRACRDRREQERRVRCLCTHSRRYHRGGVDCRAVVCGCPFFRSQETAK